MYGFWLLEDSRGKALPPQGPTGPLSEDARRAGCGEWWRAWSCQGLALLQALLAPGEAGLRTS